MDSDVPIINLMNKKSESYLDQFKQAMDPPSAQMTLSQLRRNYETINRAKSIYYPVAYQFVRELGRGRQGIVYLAYRQGARGCITEQAIKLFDPSIYRSAEEYWTDMGRIASQMTKLDLLQSNHLVIRHGYDETYGIGYTALEAINGLDLRRMLNSDHMTYVKERCLAKEWNRFTKTIFRMDDKNVCLQPGVAVYIMRGLLRGLQLMHSQNFLHYDVKPGNIMINTMGNVKLIDFGRAVIAHERVNFLLGSPMYMAPETHRREPGSFESDIFSVGLVGLEMLRGVRLLEKEDFAEDELYDAKISLADNLGSILPPHVLANKQLLYILRKMLHSDPSKRYPSAREAEVGEDGLKIISKQLVQANLDSEYATDLSDYLSKLIDPKTQRIELAFAPEE